MRKTIAILVLTFCLLLATWVVQAYKTRNKLVVTFCDKAVMETVKCMQQVL